jgi:hypothetical protein
MSTLPAFVASSKLSFVPVFRSPCRTLSTHRTKEARFSTPAELTMCLRWGLARILCVSGGNAMRGLLSLDVYVEWSEAELGEQLFLPRFFTLLIPFHSTRLSRNPL